MRIAVLVTCYNRVAVTIRGLGSLVRALDSMRDVTYDLFIVDDGSADDTWSALVETFPQAYVERGNGHLFWNRGMCRAYQLARRYGSFSDYLLFNDDVVVNPDALKTVVNEYWDLNSRFPAILAAATVGDDGCVSYSGFKRTNRFRPLSLQKMAIPESTQPCDTFNGNFVLVPSAFFDSVGGLDCRYVHAYGDIDLGYTAVKLGVQPHLSSVPIGTCSPNVERTRRGEVLKSFRGTWGKEDSLGQRLYFLRKNSPLIAQFVTIPLTVLRYGVDQTVRFSKKMWFERM